MILFENLSCLVQIDLHGRLFLPWKAGQEIQIIIEHAGLSRLLPFTLQAVDDLRRLRLCLLVHSGFLDRDLKLPDVRNILRINFVQFFLKILHLLLDG